MKTAKPMRSRRYWKSGIGGILVLVSAMGCFGSESMTISPDDKRISFKGSYYVKRDPDGVYFQRHSDEILIHSTLEKGFKSQKARTTAGISVEFRTDSDVIEVKFSHDISDEIENWGSRFGIYENGEFIASTERFNKATQDLSFEVVSQHPGMFSDFRIVLPQRAKPDFRGLLLEEGMDLFPQSPANRKKMATIGDSITHGTGQTATFETYPWILSELLDVDCYNLAVGGSKVPIHVAQMLAEFPKMDAVTELVGYNDLNGP